jgi:hypothetical protein
MPNPFQYQRPLDPDAMIDRLPEVERLIDGCEAGTMFRIDAPRRYGKTTLVGKTFAVAQSDGTLGVLIDFRGVLTLSDILVRIGRAYGQLRNPISRWLGRTLQGIELDFNVSILGAGGGLKLTPRASNEEGALFALLDLPNKIAAQGVKHLIVCFDEFQDVLQVEAADDKLRSSIQHHDQFVSYLFSGSEPRLMRQLFESRRRAFWDQAEPLMLEPLASSDVLEYIDRAFIASGKRLGEAGARLVAVADGHPQRAMFLANKLWYQTCKGDEADETAWAGAFNDAMLQEEPAFESEWRSFDSTAEQRVLRAIATYEGRPYRNVAVQGVEVRRGSVDGVVKSLLDRYVIRRIEKRAFAFVDPLFGLYVQGLARSGSIELAKFDDGAADADGLTAA